VEEINTFYDFDEDGESDNDHADDTSEQGEELEYSDMHGDLEVDLELGEPGLGDTNNLDHGFGMEVSRLSFLKY
jgi:hypothetical protein